MERLNQIYKLQKELDETIFKKFSLTDKESLRNKKLLGLIAEITKLAEATKSFKYWSRSLPATKEELLDEYANGLHFLLSSCLDVEVDMAEKFPKVKPDDDLSELFLKIIKLAIDLSINFSKDNIKLLLVYYLYLGERLGFSTGEILEAYIKINKINIEKNIFFE